MCSIEDVEVTEKNVHVTSNVMADGSPGDTYDNYYGEIDSGYYYCNTCQSFYPWTMKNRSEVFNTVKEHLNA